MRFLRQPAAFCLAAAFLLSGVARAQGPARGFWPIDDHDSAHNGWQKAETDITTATVTKDFKFLWKLKLGKGSAKSSSFSEPLPLSRFDYRPRVQRFGALGRRKHLVCRGL